jgi:hypothetical protein
MYLVTLISEFSSLVIAIVYYPYLKRSFMKWVLPFLTIICVGELCEYYYAHTQGSNIGINYIIGVAETVFYSYVFYQLSPKKSLKKIIQVQACMCVIIYIVNYLIYGGDAIHFIYALIIAGFCLVAMALGYIYERSMGESNNSFSSEPGFWIAIGVSLFFSSVSVVFSLHDYILKNNLTLFGIRLYQFVPEVLCVVLYSCISISIIQCKKKNKISL